MRHLPFCYLCGLPFGQSARTADHVPPKSVFAENDRQPLVLDAHEACNGAFSDEDKRIGQLLALKYGKVPSSPRDHALKIRVFDDGANVAVVNLDISGAVWRWIRGFHAALYQEPLPVNAHGRPQGALTLPFPAVAIPSGDTAEIEAIKLQQHLHFVHTLKANRAHCNLDRLVCNKGQLIYECVWAESDGGGPWICIFAINIYDWKDLGDTGLAPPRGCAGMYVLPSGGVPATATRTVPTSDEISNTDPLDPFG